MRYSEEHGKEQYVIPYLMSAFPGCTDEHMRRLGDWLAARRWSPRQVQCFIPTPGTVATAMYYARCAPDGSPLYVARSDEERRRQHEILLGRRGGQPPHERRRRDAAPASLMKADRPTRERKRTTGESPFPEAAARPGRDGGRRGRS